MKYDYLVVGSGLFGAVFAREMTDAGKRCLILEKRDHVGGNVYTERLEDILVHKYGAHIFHTNDEQVWKYVNKFSRFNGFVNSPLACYGDDLYNLPFNMNTFYQMWGVKTPEEARLKIESQKREAGLTKPLNLEEQAISLVGRDIYNILIKGYTEKQWGRDCKDLPPSIIKRIPVRFTFDNNYFSDRYQGIPEGGYTRFVNEILKGIEIRVSTDFLKDKQYWFSNAKKVIFTGPIDEYYDFKFGRLDYRSVRFETEVLAVENFQGVAVVNYTDREIPYTRIIEHKHFEFGKQPHTVISKEYPSEWLPGVEPYYPINDERNNALYNRYLNYSSSDHNVIFGGRLGMYKYFDMDKVIKSALDLVQTECSSMGSEP